MGGKGIRVKSMPPSLRSNGTAEDLHMFTGRCGEQNLHENVLSSLIPDGQKSLWTEQRRGAKQRTIQAYDGILLSNNNWHMQEPRRLSRACKMKKPDAKDTYWMILFAWSSRTGRSNQGWQKSEHTGHFGGMRVNARGTRQLAGVMETFYVLIRVLAKTVFMHIKSHWVVHLKLVLFTACKLYLNFKIK